MIDTDTIVLTKMWLLYICMCNVVKKFGEEAQDGGGPRREFFRLLADDLRSSMCIGSDGTYSFRHDIIALQVCVA